ncbi:MAG: GNAT family N-acetyltransferase [Saprospiraceae bacterium]|nr:GNAT family N-acetyltransferase [Saprospiraceae bacterium]
MEIEIRKVVQEDVPALKEVLKQVELFPSEMLDDMIANYLDQPDSQDIWFTAIQDNIPVSIGFCGPEELSNQTYNLFAIGVKNQLQGQGIGRQMMQFLESHLREIGGRILIVETSGTDDFKRTRTFYKQLGYSEEARIRDFWDDGDDKIIFWKRLIG